MVSVGDLYAAIDDDAAYARLPAMIASYVGGRSSICYRVSPSGGASDHQVSYFSDAMVQDLQQRFADGSDVWTQAGVGSGILNRATPLDDLVSEPVFLSSPFWNDFVRFHGDDTGRSLGLIHRFDGMLMITSVHRAWSAGAFTAAEAARLDGIGTDLHRIHRTRQMLGAANRRVGRLGDMLDAHAETVLMVDAALRLVEASPAGRRLLDTGDGISLRRGRVVFADASPVAAIRRAVANSIHRRPLDRAAFLCGRPSGAAPWRLLVLPAGDDDNSCLLLIAPAMRDPARRRRWLRDCFGFTQAELEVADGLIAGQTAEDIAQARRTSPATIRTHIRHLLDKTETRRISALIALLMGLP